MIVRNGLDAEGATVQGAGLTDAMAGAIATATGRDSLALWQEFPGSPSSVPSARRFVRDALGDCPRADDLILAASELTANAVLWSASGCGGHYIVRLRRAPRWARVEVIDQGEPPIPAVASGNGHGLMLVRGVTDRSGYSLDTSGQRTSWCEVTWP
jgi:anti-sigma regulatory factor (Ser/Thr protein kinase)